MSTVEPGVQARIVRTLVIGQVLAGLGQGATLAIGAVIVAEVAGEAWAGFAAVASTLGAAAASIPLARLAQRFGRRPALALGAGTGAVGSVVTVVGTGTHSFAVLFIGLALLGVGSAVGLQARFAATDVAAPARRGRDLSLVVWTTTIGAVVGPNLWGPGTVIQHAFGLPEHTGSFVIAIVAQLLAMTFYLVALRPDPLVLARGRVVELAPLADGGVVRGRATLVVTVGVIALSHAVMVSIMSMTPVHMTSHGAALSVVGFTISLHIAGMFALSPLFGWASDRFGRIPVILGGQLLFAVAILLIGTAPENTFAVTVALVLLGLGWSASTVSGSALVSDLVTGATRVRIQGRTDAAMSLAGAAGGAAAGPVLALVGYAGLAWIVGILVFAIIAAVSVIGGRVAVPLR